MSNSTHLQMPYILASQAQKHVTHNEAIRLLDALVQLAVLDRDLAAPPASPADGARYYVDVAVMRWQTFTGAEATLDDNGGSFADVAAERASS